MAYTTFSTANADYVLQLGHHLTENKQIDIFEGIRRDFTIWNWQNFKSKKQKSPLFIVGDECK